MEDAVSSLANRGVAIEGEIANYEHVRIAMVRDPDGNAILLAEVLG